MRFNEFFTAFNLTCQLFSHSLHLLGLRVCLPLVHITIFIQLRLFGTSQLLDCLTLEHRFFRLRQFGLQSILCIFRHLELLRELLFLLTKRLTILRFSDQCGVLLNNLIHLVCQLFLPHTKVID